MIFRTSFAVLLILLISSVCALAEGTKDEIKKRMDERAPVLTELKKLAKIGETYLGYLEVLDPKDMEDVGIKKILTDENNDRKLLYKTLAQQAGARVKLVGRQNAFLIYQKGEDEEYFKSADGMWRKKKDMKAAEEAVQKEEK